MNALVDLLAALQSAPRAPTSRGPVLLFDAASTRQLDDALARLDAQLTAGLTNLDGFAGVHSVSAAAIPVGTILRGNADLHELTQEQLRQADETQERG